MEEVAEESGSGAHVNPGEVWNLSCASGRRLGVSSSSVPDRV